MSKWHTVTSLTISQVKKRNNLKILRTKYEIIHVKICGMQWRYTDTQGKFMFFNTHIGKGSRMIICLTRTLRMWRKKKQNQKLSKTKAEWRWYLQKTKMCEMKTKHITETINKAT
jgi:hypothetical protein